jgi:hypothetical protein
MESELQHFARLVGIALICFAILLNHFHLVLRSRPDVVAACERTNVVRRRRARHQTWIVWVLMRTFGVS